MAYIEQPDIETLMFGRNPYAEAIMSAVKFQKFVKPASCVLRELSGNEL